MNRKIGMIVAATAAVGTVAAGCSGSPSAQGGRGGTARNGVVTIANESGQTWTCGFNPFNPAVNGLSLGTVYEPLVFVNTLKDAAETPMLASSYAWGPGKKSITFTVRSGVKWSDGSPFSAADVAFTFNLMKRKPALDINALWSSVLSSVRATGNKVTMTFKAAAGPYFYYFADQVGIVPQHVWASGAAAKDPVQFQDANPIGTGPFVVKPCLPSNITYLANSKYWQPGLPKISKVNYPAYTDNGPANLDLANGNAQWGSQYIPGIERFYVSKDKVNHHYWFPPVANVDIFFNLKHPITGKLAVRQAFAYAINRSEVSRVGESGYEPPSNQTGIVLPTFKKYYDGAAAQQYGYTPNPTKVKQLLGTAGYSPAKPLSLNIITISGYTDWDASLNEIKQELKPLGINLTVSDMAAQTYDDKIYKGNFDLAYGSETGGPTPYYELRQLLYSGNSAPLGQNAASNYERYGSSATDKLFDDYASASSDMQVSLIKQIQQVMLKDVPVLPVTEQCDWYEYNTKDLAGWPTEADPYAQPAAFNVPDIEQVLLHLHVK